MGVAGSIFEPHPPNFVKIHFFMSCKNAEIFVMISQVVPDLAKISVSQTSISWDVLGLFHMYHTFFQSTLKKLNKNTIFNSKCKFSLRNCIGKACLWKKTFEYLQMILAPYFAKSTGIKFGKICWSPPSRCRGVHALSNRGGSRVSNRWCKTAFLTSK